MKTRHHLLITTLLASLLTLYAFDPSCGSDSYSGFALMLGSGCSAYAYCQSGVVTSELKCPSPLLYNGGVGREGYCTFDYSVECNDEEEGESEGENGNSGEGEDDNQGNQSVNEAASNQGNEAATTAQQEASVAPLPLPWQEYFDPLSGKPYYYNPDTDVSQWQRPAGAVAPQANSNAAANDNPNNYFCGQSRDNAATLCLPCPSGSLLDCDDQTHGCFANIDACEPGNHSGSNSNPGQGSIRTKPPTKKPSPPQASVSSVLDELFSNLSGNDASAPTVSTPTVSASSASSPTTSAASFVSTPNASPMAAPMASPMAPSPSSPGKNEPDTMQPSLPPWTNAPFVPYKGPKRDKIVIGYYASWQWYDREKFADPKNVDFSKYDRVNYAFFQPDKKGRLYGTDEWADPQLLWGDYDYSETPTIHDPSQNHYCSWDGPQIRKCAKHTGEGIIKMAHDAGAEVMPSIGGWTLSDNFPTIAASEQLRKDFAANCVKLILDYDFDGIDIDWEYPAYEDHSGTPEDTVNYTKFLQAIRDALDVLGREKGRYYPLSAALPCGPDKIEKIQVDKIKDILDELNLMSYDLHGAWDILTGTNAPMFDQGWTDQSPRWSIHGCTKAYLEHGVPLEKINLGLPFYGRSFRKATGFKQFHDGPDDINFHLDEGSPQYFNIVKELSRMTTYRHEKTQTQYAVFDQGGGLVSYDDARAICDKVHYANQRGMHGFLVWEISGDMLENGETPLIDATNNKIRNPNFDCSKLRDPLWALQDQEYRYAPPEPDTVDWSKFDASNLAAPMGYSNGDVPAPTPPSTPTSPSSPTPPSFTNNNNSPTLNINNPSPPNPSPTNPSPTSGDSNVCSGGGTHAAVEKCTKYIQCSNGQPVGVPQPCVTGTLFDVSISACNFGVTCPES